MKSAYGLEIPETIGELVNAKHCALIVYDMQASIVRQNKKGPAITVRLKQVLDVAWTAGVGVFHTRHFLPKQLMGSFQFRQAMLS